MATSKKIYHAAMYLRLSQEDGDVADSKKAESNSISNQKALIKQFLKKQDDIILVSERVDDGYTGSNFDRPQFQLMMEDIKRGVVDCVIVKDLSRFGREYIDAGNYLERVFPALGVRFIAITDYVDSINNQQNEMLISFKNLLNDAYCRDISIKIRSNLEAKRRNGEYMAAFCPYGYMKDPKDKHKLIIDSEAATVVKDIFKMKLNGMNNSSIAKWLTDKGILPPLSYKRSRGVNLNCPFSSPKSSIWHQSTVKDILTNKIYIGTLTQGRYTTPNHKCKKMIRTPEEEWIVCEDTHEAIIGKREFDLVQRVLGMDTRTAPNSEAVYPLSGLIVCADCGSTMVKKDVPAAGKVYSYYVCNKNKQTGECANHRIPKEKLEDIVLGVIQVHVANILDIKRILDYINEVPFQELDIKELEKKKEFKIKELAKCKEMRNSLYEDLKEGVISQADYNELYEGYNKRTRKAEELIRLYEREINDILEAKTEKFQWIDYFAEYQNISNLTRIAAVELINCIKVYDKKHIEIVFNFNDCYEQILNQIKSMGCKVEVDENNRIHITDEEVLF